VEALGSIVRAGLQMLAGYLVSAGIWTGSEAKTYVAAAALALISIGWSLWQKYGMRMKLVTALATPMGRSEATVARMVANPALQKPPVSLAKTAVPAPVAPIRKDVE
jgi:hypothetical protein